MPALTQSKTTRTGLAALCLALAISMPAAAPAQSQAEIESALELYRLRLLQIGTRMRVYPEEALQQGLEGTAAVQLLIGTDGNLRNANLVQSSGHALLDRQALALLARAVPLTQIPFSLQNKAFALSVAIAFRLPQ